MGLFMDLLTIGKTEEFEKSIKEAYGLGFRDGRLCPADLRPCEIKGEPALFHKFEIKAEGLLKINAFVNEREMDRINRRFRLTGIIPEYCSVEKSVMVCAVIEWPDGSVTLEPAESVRFTDRGEDNK